MNRMVDRKCRVGEVWTRGRGLAFIVWVNHLDVAPQCEALLANADGVVLSRWPDGRIRPVGLMERELEECVGKWIPTQWHCRPPGKDA